MTLHTDHTLVRDITDTVSAILNDPAMSTIVRGAVKNAFLSDENEQALFDFVSARPFMERFKAKYFESEPDFDRANLRPADERHLARLCNSCLAIATARRVAGGVYRSVDDEDAQKEIARNAVPNGIRWDATKNQYSWVPPRMTFQEYYQILTEARSEPEFDHYVRKAIDALNEVGDYHDRAIWGPARNALESITYKHLRRLRTICGAKVLGADHVHGARWH